MICLRAVGVGLVWAGLLLACGVGRCEQAAAGSVDAAPPPNPMARPEPTSEAKTEAKPEAKTDIEGAMGLMANYHPEYQGAASGITKLTPGFFLRYGRYTITNASGFVTKKDDDVMRGVAADLLNNDRLRVNFALRFDRGRSESSSGALSGLQPIQRTVRGRMMFNWQLEDDWSATVGTSTDMLGNGGGWLLDASVGKGYRLAPRTTWSWSANLTSASDRYMQSYFGINDAESRATGYPVYTPSAGLRDASLSVGLRSDIGPRWLGYLGGGVSQLLGPARASPLTRSTSGWSINGGLAMRF